MRTLAPEAPGPPFLAVDRVAALRVAISADDEPAILVAHSAGCLVVAVWASEHTGPVRAALLVTPPYAEPGWTPAPPEIFDGFVGTVPRQPLPFRSILVASQNDPMATFEQFGAYAQDADRSCSPRATRRSRRPPQAEQTPDRAAGHRSRNSCRGEPMAR
ncbi:RBBP9/YdeN family alpha/beta hydrolase [Paractinoplanes toevensis]|uniref:RBBP9/YdeN family alpha/beta hydrolase n=1 Tax=Paractinoplanes toevensis TaxID=571911 RepID=UPI001BB37339|nr:alpha/beta fold hydrolase [Actinoplanes toevensis]